MAAKKKTVQEIRKEYVKAKVATNSASKDPAKLRQDFNTKAATVKGRTEIAQVLGVAGTPQAQMLRATLRSFPTASTSGASTNKDKPVVTNRGYSPGIANNVNMPSNNAASSAVVSSASKYGVNLTPLTGKVSESIGFAYKKYDTSGRKTLSLPEKGKAPIVTDLGASLRGMQGQSGFDPSTKNVVRAAGAAVGIGAIQTAIPALARMKAAQTAAGFDYYGSAAGSSSAPTPQSLIKQNEKELAKRALNFYKNLVKNASK
jgi:hypothetical protein